MRLSENDIWSFVKSHCKSEMNDVTYNNWISGLEIVSISAYDATISAGGSLIKSIVEDKYIPLIQSGFKEIMGLDLEIKIISEEEVQVKNRELKEEEGSVFPGEYEYSFETFIVGNSNKFAHAAAQAVALNPAKGYNPLFIYGGSGLGKTHLLCAICNEIRKNDPTKKIIYIKGEDFTNEIVESIRRNDTGEFRKKYRNVDVLVVDDIQFICGKNATQEEFFNTFETLYNANKQIVLAADRPPKDMNALEERIRSRFEWGLLADIQPPDYETRIAIINRKASLLGMEIPDDIKEYICTKIKINIRQLEGVVKKLDALQKYSSIKTITMGMAQNAIKDIMNDEQPLGVTVDKIVEEVARTFDVTAAELRSSKQNAPVSAARQAAMYIIKEITDMPMAQIGAEFGGRNHSTVVYNISQYEKKIKENAKIKEITNDIIRNLSEK